MDFVPFISTLKVTEYRLLCNEFMMVDLSPTSMWIKWIKKKIAPKILIIYFDEASTNGDAAEKKRCLFWLRNIALIWAYFFIF